MNGGISLKKRIEKTTFEKTSLIRVKDIYLLAAVLGICIYILF